MTNGPRFVYLSLPPTDPARSDRWLAHGRVLTGVEQASGLPIVVPRGGVAWHLVSGNHRTLARSAELFADLELAEESAAAIAETASSLRFHLVSRRAPGAYGWYASRASVPTATCARWYDSERSRRESIELALTALVALGARHHDPVPALENAIDG